MMTLDAFLEKHKLDEQYRHIALKWFKPLADSLALHQKSADKTLFVGLNGCQGSGKSTLADYLAQELHTAHGLKIVVCSLDDFYLPRSKREQLANQIHPLLATRGVPGTHDTHLLEQILLHCEQTTTMAPLAIPRFNKATDNPYPHAQWPLVTLPVDIVLFEGWCWGVKSQHEKALISPVNDLEEKQDPDMQYRRYVNTQLSQYYEPLYALMDQWIMLRAPSFSAVANWREEQEAKLREKTSQLTANEQIKTMNPAQIQAFIQYFQRLTEHGLATLPERCQWVFNLDNQRNITDVIDRSKGDKI